MASQYLFQTTICNEYLGVRKVVLVTDNGTNFAGLRRPSYRNGVSKKHGNGSRSREKQSVKQPGRFAILGSLV